MTSEVELSREVRPDTSPECSPQSFERRWQDAWRTARTFATPEPLDERAPAYVYPQCVVADASLWGEQLRTYVIADVCARFQRARGRAVLFSLGFDSFGEVAERESARSGVSPGEWVQRACEQVQGQLEALGCSCDWERTVVSSQPDYYCRTQWLFLDLLERGLIFRRDAQWFMRIDQRLGEHVQAAIVGADSAAGELQPDASGHVDGVEITASMFGRGDLTVFTPHANAIDRATFVALSPAHPAIEQWSLDPADTERIVAMRDTVFQSEDPPVVENADIVVTNELAMVPGVAGLLPVAISSLVDPRFGTTAVLGVPELDPVDRAIAARLPRPAQGATWKASRSKAAIRPAMRYPTRIVPISREQAWGAPVPVIDCPVCGAVPVPRDELPVRLPDDLRFGDSDRRLLADHAGFSQCRCPACGAATTRDTSTIEPRLDRMWMWMAACVPPERRPTAMLDDPGYRRWLPVDQVVSDRTSAADMVEQRSLAQLLQDIGQLPELPAREPFSRVLTHAGIDERRRNVLESLDGDDRQPASPSHASSDAVRLTMLSAASPGRSFSWSDQRLQQCQRFLQRLYRFAEPRLDAWSGACERAGDSASIDTSDRLRRRLAHWCLTACEKVTRQLEATELQRATLSVMRLFTRIEDFEARVLAQHHELQPEDREAAVSALLLLVALLAPLTPHIAEELWSRAGRTTIISAEAWPTPSRRGPASRHPIDSACE